MADVTKVPLDWTDVHHWREWYRDGGETKLEDLVSACRPHHVMVHEGGWRMELNPRTGEVTVTRPDGTPYELGATQAWTGTTSRRAV